jgi:sigma-B regulation protein RsbU (phosphoserine phosphatase)
MSERDPSLSGTGSALPTTARTGVSRRSEQPVTHGLERLLADALVATIDLGDLPRRLAALVSEATGAGQVFFWLAEQPGTAVTATPEEIAPDDLAAVRRRAESAIEERRPLRERWEGGSVLVLPLGLDSFGALELRFAEEGRPDDDEIRALEVVAARISGLFEEARRRRELAQELMRSRELISFGGQTTAELAVEPLLGAAMDRIAGLLGIERIAIYLCEEGGLRAAAERGLEGPHESIAARLLELALASGRSPGSVSVARALTDERLQAQRDALVESRIEAAYALSLEVGNDVVGLLVLYPPAGRMPGENDRTLLDALRNQLAVALHQARLHERATRLSSELEHSLRGERQSAAQLRALYEISRAFAQSLSLQATLEAAAKTIAELVGIDVVVLFMLDDRQERVEARALHVAREMLEEPIKVVVGRSLAMVGDVARVVREGLVLRLTPEIAAADESLRLLVPFLEGGSTAVMLPVATPKEVLATVLLVSLGPEQPIRDERIEAALAIVGQAALALDNARLYEQQKAFADTMQRSLLPDYEPEIEGLDVGAAYAASARVEIGGDLYDFMVLDDGSLAIALGDVTGHGVDAAADMAMVKFTFRSLARRYPEPGRFLAAVNEVVLEEVELGKFVTMIYARVDPARTELACASAGHPPARLLHANGRVESVPVGGLALGIVGDQTYEEMSLPYATGDALVLYTDGVIEARHERELYGTPRLDAFLSQNAGLGARELADAVLDDCRAFAQGPLLDDCAVVVVRAR